jgi:hypothetical protein
VLEISGVMKKIDVNCGDGSFLCLPFQILITNQVFRTSFVTVFSVTKRLARAPHEKIFYSSILDFFKTH